MLEEFNAERQALIESGESTEEIDLKIADQEVLIKSFNSKESQKAKIILKANDIGTLEALMNHVLNIKDSSGTRNFDIVKADIGPVNETDLIELIEFDAKLYAMDVSVSTEVEEEIRTEKMQVLIYKIIYKLLNDIEKMNDSLNTRSQGEQILGKAVIKEIYNIKLSKSQVSVKAFGCEVEEGIINKFGKYRILRNGKVIVDNLSLAELRLFKKEVKEVKKGSE